MKILLPELPFPKDSLEPWISTETVEYHYEKHHKGYVEKLNMLIAGTEYENLPLERIVQESSGELFNNAAQVWNHTFYWNCLSPLQKVPQGEFMETLERNFASLGDFQKTFSEMALEHFGSGYIWLVEHEDSKQLYLETSSDAQTPIRVGKKPILTCDLWEHAYYLDYRNEREKYLNNFFNIINWDFAARNYFSSFWKVAA